MYIYIYIYIYTYKTKLYISIQKCTEVTLPNIYGETFFRKQLTSKSHRLSYTLLYYTLSIDAQKKTSFNIFIFLCAH